MYATDTTESIVSEIDLKKLVSAILNIQYLKSQTIRRLRNDEKHVHYDLHKEVREMPGNQSIIGEFKKLRRLLQRKRPFQTELWAGQVFYDHYMLAKCKKWLKCPFTWLE